jgi:ABC-type proline/glycine betaine transport system permease subunit
VLLSLSRIIEYSLYPYAVVLQVTPVIAISPLLLIYLPQEAAVLACAWIVAFFPILSNTALGLQSVDRNLLELFELYGASRPKGWPAFVGRLLSRFKALWVLRRPAALPYFLAGLRIAGGLSLIGAVVAEIAAGSAGAGSGLAYRIVESSIASTSHACSRRWRFSRSRAWRSSSCSRRCRTFCCGAGTRAPWQRSAETMSLGFAPSRTRRPIASATPARRSR